MAAGTDYKASDVAKRLEEYGWSKEEARKRALEIVRSSGTNAFAERLIEAAIAEKVQESQPTIREQVADRLAQDLEGRQIPGEPTRELMLPPKPGAWGQLSTYTVDQIAGELEAAGVDPRRAREEADAIVARGGTATEVYMRVNEAKAGNTQVAKAPGSSSTVMVDRVNRPSTANLGSDAAARTWSQMQSQLGLDQDMIGDPSPPNYDETVSFFGMNEETMNAPMSVFPPDGGPQAGRANEYLGRQQILSIIKGTTSQAEALRRARAMEEEDPDMITQLQMELISHNLLDFSGKPVTWGVLDEQTIAALYYMVEDKARQPSTSWGNYLDRQRKIHDNLVDSALAGIEGEDAQSMQELADSLSQNLELRLSSADTIRETAQMTARQLLGRELTPEDVDQLTASIHAKERENFWKDPGTIFAQERLAKANEQLLEMKQGSKKDLDAFMASIIRIESGGNPNAFNPQSNAFGLFQFIPGTWALETARYGLDPNDKSAENQRRVAEATMTRYYNQFGNWRDVAIAWYAGPGSSHIGKRGSTHQEAGGHISVAGYADKAVAGMNTSSSSLGVLGRAGAWATGSAGTAAGFQDQALPVSRAQAAGSSLLEGDIAMPGLRVEEYEAFDMQSYLKNLIEVQGGVDVDTYRYLNAATAFENSIRKIQ